MIWRVLHLICSVYFLFLFHLYFRLSKEGDLMFFLGDGGYASVWSRNMSCVLIFCMFSFPRYDDIPLINQNSSVNFTFPFSFLRRGKGDERRYIEFTAVLTFPYKTTLFEIIHLWFWWINNICTLKRLYYFR